MQSLRPTLDDVTIRVVRYSIFFCKPIDQIKFSTVSVLTDFDHIQTFRFLHIGGGMISFNTGKMQSSIVQKVYQIKRFH